ncbi:SCO family protein [Aquisphaera insulae]|uniref:SCO family protein n=1 Tax=Aquisphaera insulae TaxID=2712864 RepID=UPI002030972A|nr:SCO family protein [Aquisphaera insulae]
MLGKENLALALIAAPMILLAAGCGSREAAPPGAEKAPPAVAEPVAAYKLVGRVKAVDPGAGEVTIRHEAISGLMPAMSMPFRVDPGTLDDIREGDEVEGKLEVVREGGEIKDYRLRDLEVTRPAPAAAMVLDLSNGTPALRPAPRRLEPGDPVPDFAMTGQDGKVFRLSDLRGKVVVLTFIYTRCPLPDFCPYMDRKFADLAAAVSASPRRAEAVRLLSVSFDPEHDTPDVLSRHARARGASPPLWSFATAPHEELAKVAGALGLIYGPGKNEIIHNLCTAVVDPAGRLARLEVGTQSNKWSSADLLKTVQSALPTAAR